MEKGDCIRTDGVSPLHCVEGTESPYPQDPSALHVPPLSVQVVSGGMQHYIDSDVLVRSYASGGAVRVAFSARLSDGMDRCAHLCCGPSALSLA